MNNRLVPDSSFLTESRLHVVGLFLVVLVVYAYSLPLHEPLYSLRGGVLVIQDFAFYFNSVVAFWLRGSTGLYSVRDVAQALRGLFGDAPSAVMPNALSPTGIIIWLPLVLVAGDAISLAYQIWMVLSLALFCWLVSSSLSYVRLSSVRNAAICCGVFLSLLSNVAQKSVMLGQSSFFAAGVLGLLALRLARREKSEPSALILACLLFLSSLKLPYLIVCLGMLVVERGWRAIVLCAVFFVLCFIVGAVWASPEWMSGYGATIVRYALGRFSEGGFFWDGFQSETLTWSRFARDLVSPEISSFVMWCGRAFGAVGLSVLFCKGFRLTAPQRVNTSLRLLLGTYLIFSSYLGVYEQMLLVLCPLVAVGTGQGRGWRTLVSFLFVYVALSDRIFPPVLSFLCKLLVFAL